MDSSLWDKVVFFVNELGASSLPSVVSPLTSNEQLKLYALYKQATVGPCTGIRPSFFDLQGRYKFDAWNELGDMNKTTAMGQYIELVVNHAMLVSSKISDDQLMAMDLDDRAAVMNFLGKVDELKNECAILWPQRFAHLRNPDIEEMADDVYDKEEVESFNIKRNATFGSPLVLAQDMGISIPSNLKDLIGGSALSESSSDESAEEYDPLQVKEPRSMEATSIDSGSRRSPPSASISHSATIESVLARLDGIEHALGRIEENVNSTSIVYEFWWEKIKCTSMVLLSALGGSVIAFIAFTAMQHWRRR